jgi:hypothetical protein
VPKTLRHPYTAHRKGEHMELKQVTVMIVGVECEPLDIQISEGATAGEILNELNMKDYLLVKGPYATRNLYDEEDVYEQVSDGDHLFALTNLKYSS